MDRRPSIPSDFRLFLASQSPRRHELLRTLGVPFAVVPSTAEERLAGASAAGLAEQNACAKARAALLPAEAAPGAFVLGTDTIVVVEGRILGKPEDAAGARAMLRSLAGRSHQVISGAALLRLGAGARPDGADTAVAAGTAATRVEVAPLTDRDVEGYVASGEWEDKAGAYAIQGLAGLFITGIEGEYANVVGLPVRLLAQLFRQQGFDLLRREWVAAGNTGATAGDQV